MRNPSTRFGKKSSKDSCDIADTEPSEVASEVNLIKNRFYDLFLKFNIVSYKILKN